MPAVDSIDAMQQSQSEFVVFTVLFNADGSPTSCHKFIRFPYPEKPFQVKFCINEGFVPVEDELSVRLVSSEKNRKKEIKLELNGGNSVTFNVNTTGTIEFFLRSGKKAYPSGFIQIPPVLFTKKLGHITQDNLKLITLISKWMGPMSQWDKYFKWCADTGYNMIHFTPLQERGHSNSPYSLRNQLKLSNDIFDNGENNETEKLKQALCSMENNHGLLGMIDMVWNHTADDTEWLREHPEAGYNLENSPHLKIAFELDELILDFSKNLSEHGLNRTLSSEEDLFAMMKVFKDTILPKASLWEYFVINISQSVKELEDYVSSMSVEKRLKMKLGRIDNLEQTILFDGKYGRFSYKTDLDQVAAYYKDQIDLYHRSDLSMKSQILSDLLSDYRKNLDEINFPRYKSYDEKVEIICRNIVNRVSYERLAEHGPKLGPIDENLPLVPTYFTRFAKKDGNGIHALANNGWIWNGDPFKNFAEAGSEAYFLRDVIIWGDCVKLRYGECRDDNPWLWDHMTAYTQEMASMFHAFRIDNCHSTPIKLATYLLDKARAVRPNLYVCAELFTGSEEKDMIFVTKLGLNSLIRESMVAWDAGEFSRLSLIYGGQSIGSFIRKPEYLELENVTDKASWQGNTLYTRPHNLFFDCTHDNEPPAQKRTPQDSLCNSAIVAFSCCAKGSIFGYDQIIPYHLNIVTEGRKYQVPESDSIGMIKLKKVLNDLGSRMLQEGCYEIYTASFGDVVVISRDNPHTHEGYTLITRTAFNHNSSLTEHNYDPIEFIGSDAKLLLSARMIRVNGTVESKNFIPRMDCNVEIREGEAFEDMFAMIYQGQDSAVSLKNLHLGDILVFKRSVHNDFQASLQRVQMVEDQREQLQQVISNFTLNDMNMILYRSEAEERDINSELGAYDIPGYGRLGYCGLEGFHSVSMKIRHDNDLSHPFCSNLRNGTWALDYIVNRLRCLDGERFKRLIEWFDVTFSDLKNIPSYLRPKYFERVIEVIWQSCIDHCFSLMSPLVSTSGEFAKKLALGSVQLIGQVNSTGLHPSMKTSSMSAGLPHFTTHHMRCWGRDIFISFKGLFLLTGRFEEGRAHLIAFGGCLYQGLLPNLLDSCRRPRFNARDAVWWFLQALQDYCKYSPEGYGILGADVPMRFPHNVYVDFDDPSIYSKTETMKEIVQNILQSHAHGIHFREWNAGPSLDSSMRSEGFNIDIDVDWRTGFVIGGNRFNCGTWMDKMGESDKAGNRGIPTTSRDGAPVELVGLLKSTLDWVTSLPDYGFKGVYKQNGDFVMYGTWAALVQENFEKEFWVPERGEEDGSSFNVKTELIRRRGIYKDTWGGSCEVSNYQMRPNYLMAMAVAPSLFAVDHARIALAMAEEHLTGPLGMKTLDSADPDYRPNYDMSDDGTDPHTARGANYHQGPEWLWCMGFYLRAWLTFNSHTAARPATRRLILTRLQPHHHQLQINEYSGLPELTNEEGTFCRDSCKTQAWSMATLLEVVVQLNSSTDDPVVNHLH